MSRTLLCEIITPERILYTNEVQMVVAPTIDGEIGVLPLHAPLVSALVPGEIRVRHSETHVDWFAVAGGYIQVHNDKVIILADFAESASTIDVERAKHSAELVRQRLAELPSDADFERSQCETELHWCETQLKVGGRAR